MKHLLLLLFAVILTTSLLYAEGEPPSGFGTEAEPYEVSTVDHLLWISTNLESWGSYFTQTADIDAAATSTWNAGAGFIPIGNEDNNFTGSYNGGNHNISNLTIYRPSENYMGLFGWVSGTTISNLALVNVNVTGSNCVGSLVGHLIANSVVNNCSCSGSVDGFIYLGGLIGSIYDTHVLNCHSTCVVTGTSNYTAGLVGVSGGSALIRNCYYSGNVYGVDGVGGIIACSCDGPVVENCYSTGNVNGQSDTGGLTGYSFHSTYSNCYSLSEITRPDSSATSVGGFCGSGDGDTFEYCYAVGSVTYSSGDNPTDKGFIGNLTSPCTCTANFFDSQTTGQTTGTGATAKTTAEMKTLATFTDAGWDFEVETTNGANDYWDMDLSGSYNDGYPFLSWQNGGDVTLPVELSGFSAHCAGQAVVLEWTTESETDNLGFILERADGNSSSWQVIASYKTEAALSSRGNTSSRSKYAFTDNTAQAGARYSFRLSDVNTRGGISVLSSLAIEVAALPLTTTLAKAYPNPFNPRTIIIWELATDGDVNLTVYDMLGRQVRELSTGYQSAGSYQVTWNGADDNGVPAASGSYLIRLQTGNVTQIQKVMFLK